MKQVARRGKTAEVAVREVAPASLGDATSHAEEKLSAAMRDHRAKARASRKRGRIAQRNGRMHEAVRGFEEA